MESGAQLPAKPFLSGLGGTRHWSWILTPTSPGLSAPRSAPAAKCGDELGELSGRQLHRVSVALGALLTKRRLQCT